MKHKILFLLFSLATIPLYASNDFPNETLSGPEPPPAPIDNYVLITVILSVVYVGYYFYKSKSFKTNN
jgi:hypothetical protein